MWKLSFKKMIPLALLWLCFFIVPSKNPQTNSSPCHIFNVSFVSNLLWTKTSGSKHLLVLLENMSNQNSKSFSCPLSPGSTLPKEIIQFWQKTITHSITQKSNFCSLPEKKKILFNFSYSFPNLIFPTIFTSHSHPGLNLANQDSDICSLFVIVLKQLPILDRPKIFPLQRHLDTSLILHKAHENQVNSH